MSSRKLATLLAMSAVMAPEWMYKQQPSRAAIPTHPCARPGCENTASKKLYCSSECCKLDRAK